MIKAARNDPCVCGSGRKYKKCCLVALTKGAVRKQNSLLAEEAGRAFATAVHLHKSGKIDAALRYYRMAIEQGPPTGQYLANYGAALDSLGRFREAVVAYHKALELIPSDEVIWNNLGLTMQSLGDTDSAEACFRTSIQLNAGLAIAHFNLGRLLQAQWRSVEAITHYRRSLELSPDFAQAHNNLAVMLEVAGRLSESRAHYERAIESDPCLVRAHRGLADVAARQVPLWHVPMMNDLSRNDAYHAALREVVTTSSTVFEIGTGSGLLAMMAARLGARHVVTCEAEETVARAAAKVVSDNGLQDRVTVLAKSSTDVEVAHLPGVPDVFVTEIFSSELLGERVLSTLEDAKRRLLPANCRMIPAGASIMCALVGGESLISNLYAGEVCGFDLRAFNAIVPRRQPWSREDLPMRLLSAPFSAFDFDFGDIARWGAQSTKLLVPVTDAGTCIAVIQWIRLNLTDTVTFENSPDAHAAAASWTRTVYLLPEPVDVLPGQTVTVFAFHDRTCPWFTVERPN